MDRKWWLVVAGCITHAVNTAFSYFGMSAFFPGFFRHLSESLAGAAQGSRERFCWRELSPGF